MVDSRRAEQYHEGVAVLMLRSKAYAMFEDFLETVELSDLDEGVAATNGKRFFIGPEFGEYSPEERAFIIAHELNHILLRHPWRGVGKDGKLYNVAGDYVINDALHLIDIPNIPLPGTPITLDDLLNTNKAKKEAEDMKGLLYDESLKDYDTDTIYRKLINERDKRQQGERGESQADSEMVGDEGEGDVNGGDVIPNTDASSEDEVIKDIQTSIKKYKESHQAGTGTEDAENRILELLNMKDVLPWTVILQRYLKNLTASNYTWSPPRALYFPEKTAGNIPNTYLPRLREKTLRVAVAIDTSGSIGDADMALFISNIRGMFNAILQQVGYVGLFMLTTDEVYWWKKMPPVPDIMEIAQNARSGGTNFIPAFKLIDEMMIAPPDVFIYFTDGYGDFPETPPKYDVLWLLTPDSDAVPPFGNVISFSI